MSVFLIVCMFLSTNPFVLGQFGLVVMWLKSQSFANCLNFSDLYSGPLSLITNCGTPNVAKIFHFLITVILVFL